MKAVIYMIICLSFCSELIHCSCLSYGHSCWGAHGKRSSTGRTEPKPQQDRWALFKLIQDENDKVFSQDPVARIPIDDLMDYPDKRIPSTLMNALQKRNLPLVLLNTDDAPELPKTFGTPNMRKRRSSGRSATFKPTSFSAPAQRAYSPV